MCEDLLRKNHQKVVDLKRGDCFRACITSLLGIPNLDSLPLPDDERFHIKYATFLKQFGLNITYERIACWRMGYWIASVPSKNYKDITHAIIMDGTKVYFDPSTKKRYRKGRNLLGKNIVIGGHWLEVTNPSKLHNLFKYIKQLKE